MFFFFNFLSFDFLDFSLFLADWIIDMVWFFIFLKSGSFFILLCSDEDLEFGEGLVGETIWFCVGWGWLVWRGRFCGCWSLEDSMEVLGLFWVIFFFFLVICRLLIIIIFDWLFRGLRFFLFEFSREGEELLRWRDVNFSCFLFIEGGGMVRLLGSDFFFWMKYVYWCKIIKWVLLDWKNRLESR